MYFRFVVFFFKIQNRWIAGYTRRDGEDVRGPEGLGNCLSAKFRLVEEDDVPALLRFGPRMYNLAIPHVTIWMRKRE